ncbi:hypothetical protein ABDA29_14105 [Bacillus pumilus]|nr:hypothetical protein [Bacillus pumilus]KMY20510.1 hypothetical protein TW93_05645 [Bacillus pumilus]MCI4617538.1 hypothetical protein [Bacillus pumilus]
MAKHHTVTGNGNNTFKMESLRTPFTGVGWCPFFINILNAQETQYNQQHRQRSQESQFSSTFEIT